MGKNSSNNRFIELLKGNNLTPIDTNFTFNEPEGVKDFSVHYEQHIRPHIEEFETKRIAALKRQRKRMVFGINIFLGVLIATILFVLFADISSDAKEVVLYASPAILIALAIWAYTPSVGYQIDIKKQIFPNIFSFFGDNYKYDYVGHLVINSLVPSDIIPDYHHEHTEDYIKGLYKDVSIEFTEAILTKIVQVDEKKVPKLVFKGMFVLLSMNKNFAGKTIVKKDAGTIGNWLERKDEKLENVKLEDPVFEEKFEVYSTDQVEARYLLTTSFMERLLKLEELFGGQGIQCSFYDDKLLLMIPSKENMFETSSIFQPATFVEDINTILEQMSLLFQIIDILKLNLKIGM